MPTRHERKRIIKVRRPANGPKMSEFLVSTVLIPLRRRDANGCDMEKHGIVEALAPATVTSHAAALPFLSSFRLNSTAAPGAMSD